MNSSRMERELWIQPIMVFFPNNIVGVVYHGFSPKISYAATYINAKTQGKTGNVKFCQLFKADALKELKRYGSVSRFEVRIRSSRQQVRNEIHNSLDDAILQTKNLAGAEKVSLVFMTKPKRKMNAKEIFSCIRHLFTTGDQGESVEKCVIRGLKDGEDTESPLDLIMNKFIVSDKVKVKYNDASKTLDGDSVCRTIVRAWERMRNDLELAGTVEESE